MINLILAAGLAILISALCSITEAALYALPWSHIENLRKQGKRSGYTLFALRADVEKPIAAVLILNTIANTAGASIAGAAAVDVFGQQSMGIFVALFTLAILICSEILPKTIGVAYSRQLAPVLARPLQILVHILMPMILITGFLGRRFRPSKPGHYTTEDDITAVVSLTRKSGAIRPTEEQTIRNILSLDMKMVKDIMTPRTVVYSLPAEITVSEANQHKDLFHYSRIPVFDEDVENIVGVVYRRRILEYLAADKDQAKISEIMRPVRFVLETLTLDRLLTKFLESRFHLFVVLDEYGGMSGVVSLEDVLEEILGKEIVDETDEVEDLRAEAKRQRELLTRQRPQ